MLLCCGRRTLIGRKAMRRRIAENAEMSGKNYFKEEAAKEMALRNNDQSKVPRYAEFEVNKSISPDRLPLNPPQTHLIADTNRSDQSGETMLTEGSYKVGLPTGPSPYGGGGYPPAVRMPRPHGPIPPVRTPTIDRRYPPPPGSGMGLPPSRSNASLNSMNRPPRSNYETPIVPPSPAIGVDRRASSVYSDYVPPRRQWGPGPAESRSLNDEYHDSNRYRPERPTIDTYNLENTDRIVDNPYVAARRTPDIDPVPRDRATRRTSESGTMIASYYEDVDPRFDDNPEEDLEPTRVYRTPLPPTQTSPLQHARRPSRHLDIGDESLPISTLPRHRSYNSLDGQIPRSNGGVGGNVDDEDRSGPRSPAASTSSHFTSVSQRGVNPRWQPQPPPQFIGGNNIGNDGMYTRRNNRPRNDQMNFLAGNPDFELPLGRSGKRSGPGAGGGSIPVTAIDTGGRYPVPR